jgi:hypothetical protein
MGVEEARKKEGRWEERRQEERPLEVIVTEISHLTCPLSSAVHQPPTVWN